MGLVEAVTRYAELIAQPGNAEDAAGRLRQAIQQGAEDVVSAASDLDLVRVVGSVWVGMVMESAVRGAEPSAACLELIALILAHRDVDEQISSVEVVPRAEYLPTRVHAAAQEVLTAGSMLPMLAATSADAESQIVFRSVQREISLRNPVYPHMLMETLRALFEADDVLQACRDVLGFTGLEAIAVMEAARTVTMASLRARFDRMEEARDSSMPYLMARQRRRTQPEADMSTIDEDERRAALAVYEAINDLTHNIDQALVLVAEELAEQSGCEPSVVEAVMESFTFRAGGAVTESLDRFFRGDNPLRVAPIVADNQGRRMLVHDAMALPAIREVVETRLRTAGRIEAYTKHRGTVVENLALDLLVRVLPGATAYRAFEYFVPDPDAAVAQTDPKLFTKKVEADGLLVIDDVAIIVEVKSVALTAEARGGVARRLRGKLRDIVTSAGDQAERLRARIVADGRIRVGDDAWIDVSGIREIHTIAVGLEDLSGVTTATASLVAAGVLREGHIPWTVSVHDLRIICELVERPSELLLYLRRRTHPAVTRKFLAVDELDLYLHYLDLGLYVVPDPDEAAAHSAIPGEPSVADRRRYRAQRRELVESRTEALDDWYQSQLDPDQPQAPKPTMNANKRLVSLIDTITSTQSPGWLSTTTTLLEGSARAQAEFARYPAVLAAHVKAAPHIHHSYSMVCTDTQGNQSLLVFACRAPSDDPDQLADELSRYLAAKKPQTGFARAALLLFDPTGHALHHIVFNNEPNRDDPQLDADAARLVPLQDMAALSTKAHKPTRRRR